MEWQCLRSWLGAARAPSPDAREGHPALRSLDASFALSILPSLAANAGSRARAAPHGIRGRVLDFDPSTIFRVSYRREYTLLR